MLDLIVTTPKSEMAASAQEAADCIRAGGGEYFRRFAHRAATKKGQRIYYVEDGAVRGFAVVERFVESREAQRCDTTGRAWAPGWYVFMRADSWQWIRPVAMKGFQGYRYLHPRSVGELLCAQIQTAPIVGGWRDPKPDVPGSVLDELRRGLRPAEPGLGGTAMTKKNSKAEGAGPKAEGKAEGAPEAPGVSTVDELYDKAVALVIEEQFASASLLQRRLDIGFSRAVMMLERMEADGLVAPHDGTTNGRAVLLTGEQWEARKASTPVAEKAKPAPSTKHISDAALLAEIEAAEADVTEAEKRWDAAKEHAKEMKDIFDGAVSTLRGIIRGKGELPLFDQPPDKAAEPTGPWQGADDARGKVSIKEALGSFGKKADAALEEAGIRTVSDLAAHMEASGGAIAVKGIGDATATKILDKLTDFIMSFGPIPFVSAEEAPKTTEANEKPTTDHHPSATGEAECDHDCDHCSAEDCDARGAEPLS